MPSFTSLTSILALAATVLGAPRLDSMVSRTVNETLPVYPIRITSATWDGSCSYPTSAKGFKLKKYGGTWYQLAAKNQPFEAGCTCVRAEYSFAEDGSVIVNNFCKRGEQQTSITGSAVPVSKDYGKDGVFKVQFPFGATNECPGPNYIVQKVYGKYEAVIVGSDSFDGWFVLSREQNVATEKIYTYIEDVAALGHNLTAPYAITPQTNCTA